MVTTHTTAKPATRKARTKKAAAAPAAVEAALQQAPVEYVPYSRLTRSDYNVRIVPHTDEEIAGYAASIKALGFLHNLVVVDHPDGLLGVVCGSGRTRATGVLVAEGFTGADEPFVPVKRIPEHLAVAASMAENEKSRRMHPAEQVTGFRKMAEQGFTPAQIGDLFGFTARHVQRILSLANLAPALIEELMHDRITLELCQVMTLEHDHARQVDIWNSAKETFGSGMPSAGWLKGQVNSIKTDMASAAFRFVGEDAYVAAGGVVDRDLFSDEGQGFADRLLTQRLLLDKLAAEAARLQREEGWAWCESRMDEITLRDAQTLRVCLPEPELTDEERATVVGLEQKLLESETEEDENALQQRIEDIESAARARLFTPAYKAAHGVVVSFEYGDFCIQRGVKRVEPAQDNGAADGEHPATDAATDHVITIKSPGIPADAFSEKLVRAMSSERTLAVQAALSGRPHVALTMLTWTLCRNVFGRIGGRVQAPLGVSIRNCTWSLTSDAPSGKQGAGWQRMQDMQGALLLTLPPQWDTDFRTMLDLSTEQLLTLLSYCVACGINGVQERQYGRTGDSSLETLESALDFDLREWWQPDADYFGSISKDQIGDALAEAGHQDRAREAMKLKKGEAAKLAAATLAETRWVPDWMTRPQPDVPATLNDTADNNAA